MSADEIELVSGVPENLQNSIQGLNGPLAEFISDLGLPTKDILSSIPERQKALKNLADAINILPIEDRAKATYLTKFTVAISMGLFDGAILYLWDETIRALRDLIVKFDLEYFFSIAENIASKYKNLNSTKDLEEISEHDILEICRRIGIISDINFKRLEHVNYMRNHASAAHPNDNEVTGIEILSLLEHCLKYAITAQPDHSVIAIRQLLNNIRTQVISEGDITIIGNDLAKQPVERIDDLLASTFGLYCDPQTSAQIRANIEALANSIWSPSSEHTRYETGSRFGYFRKNGDTNRRNHAERYLQIVNGLSYKDEDSLAAELIEKLNNLRSVHFEWNNFYNEYPHAQSILSSLPESGSIPIAAKYMFVKVICICYAGNGLGHRGGVCQAALPIYQHCVNLFAEVEIATFFALFQDSEFVTDTNSSTVNSRYTELAKQLKTKTTDVHLNKALDFVIKSKDLQKLHLLTDFKKLLNNTKHS